MVALVHVHFHVDFHDYRASPIASSLSSLADFISFVRGRVSSDAVAVYYSNCRDV